MSHVPYPGNYFFKMNKDFSSFVPQNPETKFPNSKSKEENDIPSQDIPVRYEKISECQCFGWVFALMGFLGVFLFWAQDLNYLMYLFFNYNGKNTVILIINNLIIMSGNAVMLFLFFNPLISKPRFLIGKPAYSTFWPLMYSGVTIVFAHLLGIISKLGQTYIAFVIFKIFILLVIYLMYSQDDESGSCFLFLKPYRSKDGPFMPY